jgi:hypothetical protein
LSIERFGVQRLSAEGLSLKRLSVGDFGFERLQRRVEQLPSLADHVCSLLRNGDIGENLGERESRGKGKSS